MNINRMAACAALAALLAGCGREAVDAKPDLVRNVTNYVAYATLSNDAVVVVANDHALTKGEIERDVDIKTTIMSVARPGLKTESAQQMADRVRQSAARDFIYRSVVLDEAARRGIVLDAADRQEIRRRFVKGLGPRFKSGFAGLLSRLSPAQAKALENDLDLDMLYQKTRKALRRECAVKVSDADVAHKRERLLSYNRRATAEEAAIYARATNVWKRLEAGVPFEKAVTPAEGEHVRTDSDWGTFSLAYFKDDPELLRFLRVMPTGTVTPPVAADNGLLIVKKLGEDTGGEAMPPFESKRVHLAKIFFELPEYATVGTTAEFGRELEKEATDRAEEQAVNKLILKSTIKYPNGLPSFSSTAGDARSARLTER